MLVLQSMILHNKSANINRKNLHICLNDILLPNHFQRKRLVASDRGQYTFDKIVLLNSNNTRHETSFKSVDLQRIKKLCAHNLESNCIQVAFVLLVSQAWECI